MKLNKCDVCKKEVGEYSLYSLYEGYQFDGVEHLCSNCNNEMDKARRAIEKAVNPIKVHWLKEVLRKMIKSNPPPAKSER